MDYETKSHREFIDLLVKLLKYECLEISEVKVLLWKFYGKLSDSDIAVLLGRTTRQEAINLYLTAIEKIRLNTLRTTSSQEFA